MRRWTLALLVTACAAPRLEARGCPDPFARRSRELPGERQRVLVFNASARPVRLFWHGTFVTPPGPSEVLVAE